MLPVPPSTRRHRDTLARFSPEMGGIDAPCGEHGDGVTVGRRVSSTEFAYFPCLAETPLAAVPGVLSGAFDNANLARGPFAAVRGDARCVDALAVVGRRLRGERFQTRRRFGIVRTKAMAARSETLNAWLRSSEATDEGSFSGLTADWR